MASLLDNKEKTFWGAFSASFCLGGKFIGQLRENFFGLFCIILPWWSVYWTIKRKLFWPFLHHSALVVSLLDNKEKTFLAFSASFCLGGQFIGQ